MTTEPSVPFPIPRDSDGEALFRPKLSCVLYTDYAPGPQRARRAFDLYDRLFGGFIRCYQPTSWMGPAFEWDAAARGGFPARLALLQQGVDWGYALADDPSDAGHLFMFHGYKPATETGKASFFRFEWPRETDPGLIESFVLALAESVPFLSGTAGFIIKPKAFEPDAYDAMYGIARRYWGAEAWNLDVTVNHMLAGYKCPSWLTLIGERLLVRLGRALPDGAHELASSCQHGTVYKARPAPEWLDHHRTDAFDGERAIAAALSPLQVTHHEPFGGPAWTPEATMEWLRRFAP